MNKKTNPSANILSGTPEIINAWLQLGKGAYKTQTACNALSKTLPSDLNGLVLMEKLYAQIESNWENRDPGYTRNPSKENWRWEKQLEIREANSSPEKQLEKQIAKITDDAWVNQIPVASGLTGAHALKKACVDLGHKVGEGRFELIELKCGSDHPVFAAMEIILYGLLFVFNRAHLAEHYNRISHRLLLRSVSINLRILAPDTFYRHKKNGDYQLKELERILSEGVARFAAGRVKNPPEWKVPYLKMDFKFTAFPDDFCWPCPDEELHRSLQGIKPIYG